MRRSALLLLLPAAALALAACGSDGGDGAAKSSPPTPCSATAPAGTTPTPKGTELCVGTAAIANIGKAGGRARITVTAITKAPAAALRSLDIGTANNTKSGAALWYVTMTATIVGTGSDLRSVDPSEHTSLRASDGHTAASYLAFHPDGCTPGEFGGSAVGTTVTSCAWSLLRADEQPGEVRYYTVADPTDPALGWAPKA